MRSRPPTWTLPETIAPLTGDRLGQLTLPVARDARDAHDLAGAHGEREPPQGRQAPVVERGQLVDRQLDPTGARPRRRATRVGVSSRPIITRASSRSSASPPGNDATLRPPRRTVTTSACPATSRSLWVMKRIALPASAIDRRVANSASDSCGVRTAVGSSRMSDVRPAREDPQDLDELLLADRQVGDLRADVEVHPEPLDHSLGALDQLARLADQRCVARSDVEVLGDANRSTSRKCWWTMPMPSRVACFGERIWQVSPSTTNSPRSGWTSPPSTLISVVLPAPFSPSTAWTSPAMAVKSIPSLR